MVVVLSWKHYSWFRYTTYSWSGIPCSIYK